MFAKNKVSQSLVDAVNSVVNEAEKVPTATGMKVYGSSYGNSEKARKDQLKSAVDDVKGPSDKEVTGKDPDLKYKKDTGQKRNYKVHAGRYFSNMDANKPSKGREEPRYKNEETEVAEELKGNQHKIDANHNNKIDGQDFKILRGKKKVKEDTFSGKLLNSLSESEEIRKAINEVMKKDATAGDWIHDFVHSKNPKFAGKSTKERQKMALGAYYAKQNESVENLEMTKTASEAEDTAARKSIKAKDTEKSQKIDNLDPKHGKPNAFDEEVELTEKEGTGGSDPLANRQNYAKRHGTGQVYKKTHPGDKTGMTQSFAYDIKRTGPKGKLPEEVELEEDAPKKMTDVAKQNLKSNKLSPVGKAVDTAKSFAGWLAGKNEAVDPSNQTIDTLAGRSKKVPKEAKIDNAHSSTKVELKAEEVESLDENKYLEKFLSSRGINPKFVDRNTKVAHAKSNVYKSWLKNHKDNKMSEASEVPFAGPYTKTKKDVKDKSGAVHTPMSRARDLAQKAMKKVKNETMMGVAGATSESKKK